MRCRFFGSFFLIGVSSLLAVAQRSVSEGLPNKEEDVPSLGSFHSINFTDIVGISYFYERPVSKRIFLLGEVSVRGVSVPFYRAVCGKNNGPYIQYGAGVEVQARYYYNHSKRLKKGKSVNLNAGNFVSFKANYVRAFPLWEEQAIPHFIATSIQWGMRRSFGKRFFFDFELGIGYDYLDSMFEDHLILADVVLQEGIVSRLRPVIRFRIGWAFAKKQASLLFSPRL